MRTNRKYVYSIVFSLCFSVAHAQFDPPNLRTKSARLETLQLNIGMEDETNVVGLDFWGGNPAGLVLDEKKSRIVPVASYIQAKDSWGDKMKLTTPGLYGAFKTDKLAIGTQISHRMIKDDELDLKYNQSFIDMVIGGEIADHMVVGANLGYQSETTKLGFFDTKAKLRSDPARMGVGIGLIAPMTAGRIILGAHHQINNNEESFGEFKFDGKDKMNNFSLIMQSNFIDAGVGYQNRKLERFDGIVHWDEDNLSGRLLFRPDAPWRVGAQWTQFDSNPGNTGEKERAVLVDVGVTFLFGELGLIGFNHSTLRDEESESWPFYSNSDYREYISSIGMELNITEFLAGRISYGFGQSKENYSEFDSDLMFGYSENTKSDISRIGVGGGIKFHEQGKIDLGLIFLREKDKTDNSTIKVRQIELLGTIYF